MELESLSMCCHFSWTNQDLLYSLKLMNYYSAACWLSSVDSSRLHEALCCYSSLGTEQRGKSAHAKQGRGNAELYARGRDVGEMMNFP